MVWLRNLSVGKKMLVLNVIVALFLAAVGITGFMYMKEMNRQTDQMYTEMLIPVKTLNEMRAHSRAIEAATMELIYGTDKNTETKLLNDIETRLKKSDLSFEIFKKRQFDEYGRQRLERINQLQPSYRTERVKALDLALAGKNAEAYACFKRNVSPPLNEYNVLLEQLAEYTAKEADALNVHNEQEVTTANSVMIGIIIVAIVICAVLCVFISRMIVRPLTAMQELMVQAENGNMTVRGQYQSKDEIGSLSRTFNGMLAGLHRVLSQVNRSAEELATNSGQLSASAEETTRATHEIAASTQSAANGAESMMSGSAESARSMEEMAAGIQRIAENSSVVSEASDTMAKEALQGNEMMKKAGKQMELITASVSRLSKVIGQLDSRSQEIDQIVSVITGIASQTNLLALNAAIEAARAGEAGRGFAVVADEVRKLAEQSEVSAGKIARLIQEIQDDTRYSVQAMEQGMKEVEEGRQTTLEAGQAFAKIASSAQQVAEQIQEVSAATEEMSASSEQVTASIMEISHTARESADSTRKVAAATQEQLASMEQITTAVESLNDMARTLDEVVRKFRL